MILMLRTLQNQEMAQKRSSCHACNNFMSLTSSTEPDLGYVRCDLCSKTVKAAGWSTVG